MSGNLRIVLLNEVVGQQGGAGAGTSQRSKGESILGNVLANLDGLEQRLEFLRGGRLVG